MCFTHELHNYGVNTVDLNYNINFLFRSTDILSLVFHVNNKLEDSEEDSLSDELAARMALVDRNSMEEEPSSASVNTFMNPAPGPSEVDGKVKPIFMCYFN